MIGSRWRAAAASLVASSLALLGLFAQSAGREERERVGPRRLEAAAGGPEWFFCASEERRCVCQGAVRWGTTGSKHWHVIEPQGGKTVDVLCALYQHGGAFPETASGVAKHCECKRSGPAGPPGQTRPAGLPPERASSPPATPQPWLSSPPNSTQRPEHELPESIGIICERLGAPPYYHHGKYADPEFEKAYPLKAQDFARVALVGGHPALEWVLNKLAVGLKVRLAVIGGSFTWGAECWQGKLGTSWRYKERGCSWVWRFRHWLEDAFPTAEIEFLDWIQDGTPACAHLPVLPTLLGALKDPVDVVIIDTLVNGLAQDAEEDSVCLESILLTLHEITPDTAVFTVLAASPAAATATASSRSAIRSEEAALRHYGLPFLNAVDVALGMPEFWVPRVATHPTWHTHQMMADLLASMWGGRLAEVLGCTDRPKVKDLAWPRATYHTAERLAKHGNCMRPLSSYSARDPGGGWNGKLRGAAPTVTEGNWTLYEDRAGKPGWMSSTKGSTLRFDVTFGSQPSIAISYLRSYKGLGSAIVMVDYKVTKGRSDSQWRHDLPGKWTLHNSQTDVYRIMNPIPKEHDSHYMPPYGTARVWVTNTEQAKFKLIALVAC